MRLIDDGAAVLAWSPAKLNLLLAIRGRRPDGFHEIETLMIKVSLFDSLRFTPRDDGEVLLRVHPTARGLASIPADGRNLILRAAELLRESTGASAGADILLEKRIPAEAGLAGGSGNAAAALAGLARLWRLNVPYDELAVLGGQLGSDIPFFLSPATAAVARGRGEKLEPVTIARPLHFVIAKPSYGLSTADVYRTFASTGSPSGVQVDALVAALASGQLQRARRLLHNDLMPAAEMLQTDLAVLRSRLDQECTYGGLMTGSGSACFGLCATAREATLIARRLQASRMGRLFAVTSA